MEADYYKVLGVPRTSSSAVIKQRYRALSKQHHPDLNGGDNKAMARINTAYDTLSIPSKRERYNLTFKSSEPQVAHTSYRSAPQPRTSYRRKKSSTAHRVTKRTRPWPFTYFAAVGMALFALAFFVGAIDQTAPGGPTVTLPEQTIAFNQTNASSVPGVSNTVDTPSDDSTTPAEVAETTQPNQASTKQNVPAVQNPTNTSSTVVGSTCKDGTISYSKRLYNRCARHGGVASTSLPTSSEN